MLTTRVSGVTGAIQGVRRFGFMSLRRLNEGVGDAIDVAFDQSQVYVPVEFGPLKASGKKVKKTNRDGVIEGSIEYGGSSAPYALPVHEIAGAYHAPPTTYKYLERAIRETKDRQSWALRRRMRTTSGGYLR